MPEVAQPSPAALRAYAEAFLASPLGRFKPWEVDGRSPQRDLLVAARTHRVRLFRAGNQVGKAQPIDEPVLTPSGWRAIGELRPGDSVIAGDGSRTSVLGVFPQGEIDVFRVAFDDGASTRASGSHLWRVLDREGRFPRPGRAGGSWRVLTTSEILARWGAHPSPVQAVAIPVPSPVETESDARRPLDPYLLGVLIGDGCFRPNGVSLSTGDPEIVASVNAALPAGLRLVRSSEFDYRVTTGRRGGDPSTRRRHHLLDALRSLGLAGLTSERKFVPSAYLFAPPADRLAILQGLLDTDGTVGKGGCVEFCTVSDRLKDDVVYLVRSMGGKCSATIRQTHYPYKGERRAGRLSWRVRVRLPGFRLFRLARKHARCFDPTSRRGYRVLRSILPAGRSPCVCIAVEHSSQTYVTRDLIVTHNTKLGGIDTALRLMGWHPHAPWKSGRAPWGWVVGLDWEMIGQFLWPAVRDALPAGMIRAVSWHRAAAPSVAKTIVLRNGARLDFKSAEAGREKFQSASLDFAWCDEEIPPDVFEELRTRLVARYGGLLLTLTPLRREAYVRKLETEEGTAVVEASMMDAARAGILGPDGVKSVQDLADSLPDRQRRVRILGQHATLEGLVYPEFTREKNVVRPLGAKLVTSDGTERAPWPIPEAWPRFAAIDFGYSNPCAVPVVAIDPSNRRAFVYRCYYAAYVRGTVWAEFLKATLPKLAQHLIADHDADERAEFAARGVGTQAAKKDVIPGIEAVERWIGPSGKPPRLYFVLEDPAPRTELTGRCDALPVVSEIESYHYPKKKSDDAPDRKDLPEKVGDHACDSVRYLAMVLEKAYGSTLGFSTSSEALAADEAAEAEARPGRVWR